MENYQKRLEQELKKIEEKGTVPSLLLHSCCAPCSSYVLEYLTRFFAVTVFYYNPNIAPAQEYEKRIKEQERFLRSLSTKYPVDFLAGPYEPDLFYEMAKGMEEEPEGGARCMCCYELRLRKAAVEAVKGGFSYFTTTLSISPMKKADKLNEIGKKLSEEYGVPYLYSDFKKKGGYQRSIALSKEYGLYRQNYCGCVFSRRERLCQEENRKENGQAPLQPENLGIK